MVTLMRHRQSPPPVRPAGGSARQQTPTCRQTDKKGDSKVNNFWGPNYALLSAGPTAPAENCPLQTARNEARLVYLALLPKTYPALI